MKVPCGLTEQEIAKTWKDIEIAKEALKNPFTHAQVMILVEAWLKDSPRLAALKDVNPELYESMYEGLMWERCMFFLEEAGYC